MSVCIVPCPTSAECISRQCRERDTADVAIEMEVVDEETGLDMNALQHKLLACQTRPSIRLYYVPLALVPLPLPIFLLILLLLSSSF